MLPAVLHSDPSSAQPIKLFGGHRHFYSIVVEGPEGLYRLKLSYFKSRKLSHAAAVALGVAKRLTKSHVTAGIRHVQAHLAVELNDTIPEDRIRYLMAVSDARKRWTRHYMVVRLEPDEVEQLMLFGFLKPVDADMNEPAGVFINKLRAALGVCKIELRPVN